MLDAESTRSICLSERSTLVEMSSASRRPSWLGEQTSLRRPSDGCSAPMLPTLRLPRWPLSLTRSGSSWCCTSVKSSEPRSSTLVAINRNIWFAVVMTTARQRQEASSTRVAAQIVNSIRDADPADVAVSIGDHRYPLGPELAELITALLDDVSYGREVTPAPTSLPIGTEVASELLGVSRPWLTTLIDRGEIPSTRTGTKRRMRLGDVLAYRRSDDTRRDRSLKWDFLDDE
jgi:excisionase family DNA binding protein